MEITVFQSLLVFLEVHGWVAGDVPQKCKNFMSWSRAVAVLAPCGLEARSVKAEKSLPSMI